MMILKVFDFWTHLGVGKYFIKEKLFLFVRDISARDLGIGPYELADVKITQIPNETFNPDKRDKINKIDSNKISAQSKSPFVGNGGKIGINNSETISVNLESELGPSINSTRIQVVLPNGTRKVISISARSKVSELYSIVKKEYLKFFFA
jgi:hypothetical protein